jgi:hypothetical protein
VFVTLGNHDMSEQDELARLIEARGQRVLRNDSCIVRRGQAELVVAGVDARRAPPSDVKHASRATCRRTDPAVMPLPELQTADFWTWSSGRDEGAFLHGTELQKARELALSGLH